MYIKKEKKHGKNVVLKKVKYYNEKVDIIELWQKLSDDKRKTKHANIFDVALKRIGKYCSKKNKRHHKRRKRKIQSIF